MNVSIIYEDDDILAVNKPAGMVAHHANLKHQISKIKTEEKELFLTDWLVDKYPEVKSVGEDALRPGIVHRLDKVASGVLVIAKNQPAFEYLKSQFKDRKIVKKYIALVEGVLKNEKGIIDLPIGKSKSDFRKKLASDKAWGELREAVTEYRVLEKFADCALLEVYPKTGRTHQIRAHLKAIGHPVVCDSLYGGKKARCPFDLKRHFLHANFLEFNLLSGGRIKLEADMPGDLENVLRTLRKDK